MTLTVVQVAYPFAPVGPDEVGGAEQILSAIDRGLARAGHRSIVLARRGSRAAGELVDVPLQASGFDETAWDEAHRAWRSEIARLASDPAVDLFHFHGGDFFRYLPPEGPPALVTLHLPLAWYPAASLRPARPRTWLHCVSRAQRESLPGAATAHFLDEIENGVAAPEIAPGVRPRVYAVVLGRICPEKNVHAALDAGRIAGAPVLVAGRVFPYPAHVAYFESEVRPRLDRLRRFIGPVTSERKRRLLAGARCLLVPSLAPETASLAAMEALASGTPVVAYPVGALPGLIEHGRTGFLVDGPESMAEAIEGCRALDRDACRAAALERFPLERMIERYFEAYRAIARRDVEAAAA